MLDRTAETWVAVKDRKRKRPSRHRERSFLKGTHSIGAPSIRSKGKEVVRSPRCGLEGKPGPHRRRPDIIGRVAPLYRREGLRFRLKDTPQGTLPDWDSTGSGRGRVLERSENDHDLFALMARSSSGFWHEKGWHRPCPWLRLFISHFVRQPSKKYIVPPFKGIRRFSKLCRTFLTAILVIAMARVKNLNGRAKLHEPLQSNSIGLQ